MNLLGSIKKSISKRRYNISLHARREMSSEEDNISENELIEVILNGEIIEDYPDDRPFPSCLVFGKTKKGRPIHIVCAYSEDDDITVVITTYEPDPSRWIDYKRRIR